MRVGEFVTFCHPWQLRVGYTGRRENSILTRESAQQTGAFRSVDQCRPVLIDPGMLKRLLLVFLLSITAAGAETFQVLRTLTGIEFRNVTIRKVEPDGIRISHAGGDSKVLIRELPEEIRFRYYEIVSGGAPRVRRVPLAARADRVRTPVAEAPAESAAILAEKRARPARPARSRPINVKLNVTVRKQAAAPMKIATKKTKVKKSRSGGGGTTYVKGYTTKSGKVVRGHYRKSRKK